MEKTNAASQPTRDGEMFGPFSRYQVRFHESKRKGIDSQWFVFDAETPDEVTGAPSVIRQEATIPEAISGLPLEATS